MTRDPSSRRKWMAFSLAVLVSLALVLGACNSQQLTIDQAVAATRTQDKINADTLATALAGTLAARPPEVVAPPLVTAPPAATVPPAAPTEAAPAQVCTENMGNLTFLSSGYLDGGRFLITLEKPQGFQNQFRAQAYTLLVNGSPYACSIIGGNLFRIYCTGRPIPPPGLAQVQLLSADSSCKFDIPFSTVSIIPPPVPTAGPGGYK